jgi:beta-N-acetylhexosaminidase
VPPQPDPLRSRVDLLLQAMTLEQKLGQLFLVAFEGSELSPQLQTMISDYHIGGIILYTICGNLQSLTQVAQLTNAVQGYALQQRGGMPLWVGIDQEGGSVRRLPTGSTPFPSHMAIGATASVEYARQMAAITAIELQALGINLNFAPVVDVNSNPANPIIGTRAFGSSPQQVARLGAAMLNSYAQGGILAAAKHFPGHGDTDIDSHRGLPTVPRSWLDLQRVDLFPFVAAIEAGADLIMTAHVVVPALDADHCPATLSPLILDRYLRQTLGFEGLIITDSLGMGALDRSYDMAQAAALALQAGADILLFGADVGHEVSEQQQVYQDLLAQVRASESLRQRVEESVRRVVQMKAKYGLLDFCPVDVSTISEQVGIPAHAEVARQIGLDSVTLIKHDNGILPLKSTYGMPDIPDQPVLVIWPQVRRDLSAAMRAVHRNLKTFPISLDPLPVEIAAAQEYARNAAAIVVGTFNTDRHPAQTTLIRSLPAEKVIGVALESPYDLMHFPEIPCYLATYGDVPASLVALAQILAGVAAAKGHLPVELPGLFPLGHGLTDPWPSSAQ